MFRLPSGSGLTWKWDLWSPWAENVMWSSCTMTNVVKDEETQCVQSVTFFTLCGFFSLRHLRMSISVVLTQPGCGRQQKWQSVSVSDDTQSLSVLSPRCDTVSLQSRPSYFIICLVLLWSLTHYWSVNVPERPLLAVKDLSLCLVLLPVDSENKGNRLNFVSTTMLPQKQSTHFPSGKQIREGQNKEQKVDISCPDLLPWQKKDYCYQLNPY